MIIELIMNFEVNVDDIDVEMMMEEVMVLEVVQCVVVNLLVVVFVVVEFSLVFKFLMVDGLGGVQCNDIDMILDIFVQLMVELGCIKVFIKNLLQFV